MNKIPLEIIIPIYNEGSNLIKLFNFFAEFVKTNFRVLLCYDNENDDAFNLVEDFKRFNFEIIFVKSPINYICI